MPQLRNLTLKCSSKPKDHKALPLPLVLPYSRQDLLDLPEVCPLAALLATLTQLQTLSLVEALHLVKLLLVTYLATPNNASEITSPY